MRFTPRSLAARGWLRFGGVILFALVIAGCIPAGAGRSPAATAIPIGTTAATPGGSSSVGSAATSPSSAPPATQLGAAIQSLRAASRFQTTVDVDGETVVVAEGRTLADASQVTVTSDGRSIDYLQIPPGAWAREGAGAWVVVAGEAAPATPLDVLAKPLTLKADAGGAAGTFIATYPAKALGLTGGPLTVLVAIAGDSITFTYNATTSGHATTSTTVLQPGSGDPITAP